MKFVDDDDDDEMISDKRNILDIQYHESLYIIDKYNDGSMSGSVAACIFRHCQSMCWLYVFLLISSISIFSV